MPGGSGSGTKNRSGRWTRQEHERFLRGYEAVGERWCLVATYVPSRTERQVRTHAQKYLRKVRQGLPFPDEPYQSSVENDNGEDDDVGAHVDGGAAAAANGEPGPPARLPADAFRYEPHVAAPSFDGHEYSRNSDSRRAAWDAGDGGQGGGAAPLYAPVATAPPWVNPDAAGLADNLHGAWLHNEPAHGAPGFRGQQQQQFLPFRGHGADLAGGRFSPPEGEAAPFRNWPVADGDRHANLLVEYGIGDMVADGDRRTNLLVEYGIGNTSSNGYTYHNYDSDNDGAAAGAPPPHFR